uniref:Deuterosome assembly protein 1 n=1 Tax=Callithrix jacchus TaxID=9483 RepID=A0A5F4WAH7_CALJA
MENQAHNTMGLLHMEIGSETGKADYQLPLWVTESNPDGESLEPTTSHTLQEFSQPRKTTSPCEAELQELMEQIDIMVSNKKLDWERKMRALETRLDLRDQELANAQTCLDQKGQEVVLLRQKLDSLEKCNLAMTQNYEGQLQSLKAQIVGLLYLLYLLAQYSTNGFLFLKRLVDELNDN